MSTASVLSQMRLILGDQGESFIDSLTGDGTTREFDLPVLFVDDTTFQAILTGTTPTILTPNVDYVLDARAGQITFTTAPVAGAQIIVSGSFFQEFTNEDLSVYLQNGYAKHIVDRNPVPLLDPTPPQIGFSPVEENLVAIRGVIEALWGLATDASMDVDIVTPDGVHIPRSQRFAQIMQMIQAWEAEYQKIAEALNVGLFRVEMFDLRRVSRTTNRYVPIYKPREYDDRLPPQRILLPIDNMGGRVITYRSTWVSGTAYAIDDVVDYQQQRYICVQATSSVVPGTDTNHWQTTTINTGWYPGT